MPEYRFCPNCGAALTGRTGSATTKIELEKLDELRAKAVRSLPPPPALPSLAIEECARCSSTPPPTAETLPDAGWLRKHLRERARRTRRRLLPAVLALLALAVGLVAYAALRGAGAP